MSVFLRKITYRLWEDKPWLLDGELQVASLKDMRTLNSRLSVYLTGAGIGINRMVAAIAASATSVAQVDYVFLDIEWLEGHGFRLESTPDHGRTPDRDVNGLHYDIHGLTVSKLYELALHKSRLIRAEQPFVGEKVAELIDESICLCHIDEESLNKKLVMSLNKFRKIRKRR